MDCLASQELAQPHSTTKGETANCSTPLQCADSLNHWGELKATGQGERKICGQSTVWKWGVEWNDMYTCHFTPHPIFILLTDHIFSFPPGLWLSALLNDLRSRHTVEVYCNLLSLPLLCCGVEPVPGLPSSPLFRLMDTMILAAEVCHPWR